MTLSRPPNEPSLPASVPLCSPLSLILGLAMWHVDLWDMSKHDTNGGLLISIRAYPLARFPLWIQVPCHEAAQAACGEPPWRKEAPSRVLSGASPSGVSKSQPRPAYGQLVGERYFIFSVIKQPEQRKSDGDLCGLQSKLFTICLHTKKICQPGSEWLQLSRFPDQHHVKNCPVDPQNCEMWIIILTHKVLSSNMLLSIL